MSPEQKQGYTDNRSDLYAVGLIGFQLLTGKERPSVKPPSRIIEGIHRGWDAWFESALRTTLKSVFSLPRKCVTQFQIAQKLLLLVSLLQLENSTRCIPSLCLLLGRQLRQILESRRIMTILRMCIYRVLANGDVVKWRVSPVEGLLGS